MISTDNWSRRAALQTSNCLFVIRTFLLAVCLVVGLKAVVYADCSIPHYRVGKIVESTDSTLLITISVGPSGFAPTRLICLAQHLKHKYPHRDLITAFFFESHEAAVNYSPGTLDLGPKAVQYQSQMHASYYFNAGKHEEYLLLMPDPFVHDPESPFNTRIDLPFSGAAACTLQVTNRCLLTFRHILYPWQEGKAEVSGSVTVTGIINRAGRIMRLAVAEARVDPRRERKVLVDATVNNVKTWHFEASNQRTRIRITYSFELADSPSLKYKTEVQFALPQRVIIKTGVTP